MEIKRFEVHLVNLDPTIDQETKKTRPCVVISPDEMNYFISTIIIAPMTTKSRRYPNRVACKFKGKSGEVVLDQIRTIDKSRLVRKLGVLDSATQRKTIAVLQEMFSF